MNDKEKIRRLAFQYASQIITPEQEMELNILLEKSPRNEIQFQKFLDQMTKFAMHWRDLMIKDGDEMLQRVLKNES